MGDTIEDRAREYVDEWGLEDYEDEALAALLPLIRAEVARAYKDSIKIVCNKADGDIDFAKHLLKERAKEVAGEQA